jgi:hypothetical protein
MATHALWRDVALCVLTSRSRSDPVLRRHDPRRRRMHLDDE